MTSIGGPKHDPVPIGEVSAPVFSRAPDPDSLFDVRCRRLRQLAADNGELRPYLEFLAKLAQAQHEAQHGLPEPVMPDRGALDRAREYGLPPLDRNRLVFDAAFEQVCDRLFALAADPEAPPAAAEALVRIAATPDEQRRAMAYNVTGHSIPAEALAEHVYLAAALQVHFARLAARLDHGQLVVVGDGACPACGSPPVSSVLTAFSSGAQVSRYCVCSLCATAWHYVRVKCVLCGSTGGITYQEVETGPKGVKAETCDSCRCYVKVLHQHQDPALDPVADDVATLGLDLLVREGGYRRGAVNLYLLGY